MDKINKLLEKAEVMPLSPALLPKLLPKLGDVDANFDEVVGIIEYDPTLTARLLQICNSAFFGQSEPVATVAQAVNLVGYQAVYLLVAMINGSNCFPTPLSGGIDATRLWRHSITAAFNTKFVAESARQDGSLLFTAGLLHDIGKVILGQAQPQQMLASIYAPTTSATLERECIFFGINHAEVGATLLERWKLPAPLVEGVRCHHNPRAAQDFEAVATCIALGNLVTHSQNNPKIIESDECRGLMHAISATPETLAQWQMQLRDSQGLIDSMSKLPVGS